MSGISERNPFVGPRPIQIGEALFGRNAELHELYHRLQARRIVVLHAPSGAGKSSLVQAGLIPKLKGGRFDVWKPIRVNLDPDELSGLPTDTNRYQLSALVSMEEELPGKYRRPLTELVKLDLLDYVERRPRRKGHEDRPIVLLFDQFEEILTLAPHTLAAKRAFFTAIGRMLEKNSIWALFVIREDYLAAFAPYRDLVPTQLSNTVRLDFLGLDGARESAQQLARLGGRTFPGVEQLVSDLSAIRIQRPDGSIAVEQGPYVEPLHLQVVCRRLWEAMPDSDLSIDASDIQQYADITKALGAYYAQSLQKIAGRDLGVERQLREWIGGNLVVGGTRSQVRQGVESSAGLANNFVEQLLGTYLVRSEQRAGANWFELSHDRLVEPVQQDNQEWEREHLQPVQIQAKLWEAGRRRPALLLNGDALPDAEEWAQRNARTLTEGEREFLQQSRKAVAERSSRLRQLWIGLGLLSVLLVGAVTAAVVATEKSREARRARQFAEEQSRNAEQQKQIAEQQKRIAERRKAEAELAMATALQKEKEARKAEAKVKLIYAFSIRNVAALQLAVDDPYTEFSRDLRFVVQAKELQEKMPNGTQLHQIGWHPDTATLAALGDTIEEIQYIGLYEDWDGKVRKGTAPRFGSILKRAWGCYKNVFALVIFKDTRVLPKLGHFDMCEKLKW